MHAGIHTPLGRHPPAHTPVDRHPPADTPWADTPGGHCSGRYASYWNAFLFETKIVPLVNTLESEKKEAPIYVSGGSRIFQMGDLPLGLDQKPII